MRKNQSKVEFDQYYQTIFLNFALILKRWQGEKKRLFKLGSSLGLLMFLQPHSMHLTYATNTYIADMMYLVKNAHMETVQVQFFEKIVHVSKILTSWACLNVVTFF